MKKAILITVGAIAGTTSLIAGGVFLPSLYLNSSPSTIKVNANNVLISNKATSSVTVKEAILGTKKVNNGNYVLYFGSEGIDSNFKFLYNVPQTANSTVEKAKEEQMTKRNKSLSGDYWSTVNYVSNNIKASEELVRPEFIAYVNLLGDSNIEGRKKVAQEATDCLWDVINAKEAYSNGSSDFRSEIIEKYNFVKNIMVGNATLRDYLGDSVLRFFKNLDTNYNQFHHLDDNTAPTTKDKTVQEVVTWTVYSENIPFKTNPFDTYKSWDQQTKYYDDSSYNKEFRELWSFIQNYPLFSARKPKDINANNGFIIGYRDGVLTELYDDSFESVSTEDTENKPEGEQTFSIKNTTQENAPQPSDKNSFYTWINKQYSIDKK